MKHVPNILCIIRICLIPFILIFLLPNSLTGAIPLPTRILISGIIFGIAMLTDLFDGKIARKYNAITNFGKFIDPLADKLLVICIMLAFVDLKVISLIPVLIIIAREFIVTGLRLSAASKNVVVAANIWGKIKTMFQGVSLGVTFLILWLYSQFITPEITDISALSIVPGILAWINALITAISAISYIIQMKDYIKD